MSLELIACRGSNADEVLGIAEGNIALRIGGDAGSLFQLKAGDMIVLPAGVGHRRVGGEIPRVALPETDPFFRADGPLVKAWHVKKHSMRGTSQAILLHIWPDDATIRNE
jgi:uncharacterized protein YjlB